MTSYLGTIETSLSPAVNFPGVIKPRLPSVYEEWQTGVAGERRGTSPWTSGEARVVQPPADRSPVGDQGETRRELHPRMKAREASGSDAPQSSPGRDDAHERGAELESEPDSARERRPQHQRVAGARRAGVEEAPERVVVRAVLRKDSAPGEAAATGRAAPAVQIYQGISAAAAARSHRLVIPQSREQSPMSHRRGVSGTNVHRQREPDSHEPAEPAVVVTIGRIEVRAVTPPPSPRPSPERRPMMSLDDYLQQRIRGAR